MRILVVGAGGAVGVRVVREAVSRGHQVTGVGRTPETLRDLPSEVRVLRGDASVADRVAELSRGQDVVVSATRPRPGAENELVQAAKGLVDGLSSSGVRLLVVGGAGSLTLPGSGGVTVVDGSGFPDDWRPIALACNEQLAVIRSADAVDWTYLSPPALLEPGERTGTYRLGQDELVVAEDGVSSISLEDFAVALVDEVEQRRHAGRRFTVGY